MDSRPLHIRRILFNITKSIDRINHLAQSDYRQVRIENVIRSFGRICPKCHFTVDNDSCPVCGSSSVIPTYCKNCDDTVDSQTCPKCGIHIYFRKIKSSVNFKDITYFPN